MKIEIIHYPPKAVDIAPIIDLDKHSALKIPDEIKIGSKSKLDGSPISGYLMQVDEYDIWLEDQLKAENQKVMSALEDVFYKAQTSGVTLLTRHIAAFTHAHAVKRTIERLAGGE